MILMRWKKEFDQRAGDVGGLMRIAGMYLSIYEIMR